MSKIIAASVIALTMGFGGLSAAGQLGGVVDATKDAAKATTNTTKKVVGTAGKETQKAATTTKNAVTGKAHSTCVDGTRHTAKNQKTADAACAKHGGVAK
jgi:hypothetical protein